MAELGIISAKGRNGTAKAPSTRDPKRTSKSGKSVAGD